MRPRRGGGGGGGGKRLVLVVKVLKVMSFLVNI